MLRRKRGSMSNSEPFDEVKEQTMKPRCDLPPVTKESIELAKQGRDAERAAAGIICDRDGRVLLDLSRKSA